MPSNHTLFSDYTFTLLDGAVVLGGLLEVSIFIMAMCAAVGYQSKRELGDKKKHRQQRTVSEYTEASNSASNNNNTNNVNRLVQLHQGEHRSPAIKKTVITPTQPEDHHHQDLGVLHNRTTAATIETLHSTSNRIGNRAAEVQEDLPVGGTSDDDSVASVVLGIIRLPPSCSNLNMGCSDNEAYHCSNSSPSCSHSVFPNDNEEQSYANALRMSTFFKFKREDSPIPPKPSIPSYDAIFVNGGFEFEPCVEEPVGTEESFDSGRSSNIASDSSRASSAANSKALHGGCDSESHTVTASRSVSLPVNEYPEVSVDTGLPVTEHDLGVDPCDTDSVKDTIVTAAPIDSEMREPDLGLDLLIAAQRHSGLGVQGEGTRDCSLRKICSSEPPQANTAVCRPNAHAPRTEPAKRSRYFSSPGKPCKLKDFDIFTDVWPGNGLVEICVDTGRSLNKARRLQLLETSTV